MKRYVLAVLIACAAAGAVVTSDAFAADHGQGRMSKLDTNKDGQLSRDEVRGHGALERNFDALDTNKDGLLSRAELKAGRSMLKADAQAHKGEHFKKMDLNNDGKLSRDEFTAAHPRAAKKFDQIDTNKDGFLSQDELKAWHASHKGKRS